MFLSLCPPPPFSLGSINIVYIKMIERMIVLCLEKEVDLDHSNLRTSTIMWDN